MIDVLLKTLPFFALIGVGYLAGRTKFFSPEGTAFLTKFVFYFALPAMLFRFSATLDMAEVFDLNLLMAYFWGTLFVYLLATVVAFMRGVSVATAAVEAQCAAIGNTGFLGIPMFILLLGPQSVGPAMLTLAVDLTIFASLIVILITGSRDGRMSPAVLKNVGKGLIQNPMIVAISLGLMWSVSGMKMPAPMFDFVSILGGAATPGALFAIGASLATKSAEKLSVAGWLGFCKLVLHPLFVAIAAFYVFPVEPYAAAVIIATAALPVAGNIYIIAQHYGVAPQRVSATILVSTTLSVVTVSAVIAWVTSAL